MDWTPSAVLAAVVLLESIRRLPVECVVIRRRLGGPWTVVMTIDDNPSKYLTSWQAPFSIDVVLPRVRQTSRPPSYDLIAARTGQVWLSIAWVRVLGAIDLILLVLALPFATSRYGSWGFTGALMAILFDGSALMICMVRGLRRLGMPTRRALRTASRFLSPFRMPQASALLIETAVAELGTIATLQSLLAPEAFVEWLRPMAYDAINGQTPDADDELGMIFTHDQLAAIYESAPSTCSATDAFCPRCGQTYQHGTELCTDCGGVALCLRTS